MQKDVIFSEKEGRLTARLLCDIDHHTAKSMRESIDKRMFEVRPNLLIIDFSDVVFMDSSGLGLIIGRAECASALSARVEVCGLSPALTKLIRLCNLDRIKNLSLTR